jgi:class 3 adenylate cyclase
MYPSWAGDIEFREWYARYLRACLSPREVAALLRVVVRFDLREICRTIQAPTLVVHSRGSRLVPFGLGEDLARRIPGARFVALDGAEGSLISGGSTGEAALDAIQEFMTGTRGSRRAQRVLATLLFIDLVDSTRRAAELGDSAWRSLLEEQRWLVRQELSRHDGREIDTAGDGFLVFFDGPGRAARCAQSIVERVRTLGLEARAGLHTGECELVDEGVAGLAVHLAARVMALGGPGEVLATSTVRDLVVGSSLEFEPRGPHVLKGVPGEWEVFALRA